MLWICLTQSRKKKQNRNFVTSMKVLTDVKIYQCEYCGKVSLSAGGIKYHESFCKKNPTIPTAGADCFSCSLLKVVDAENERTDCHGCMYRYFEWDTGYSECEKGEENCHRQPKNFICTKTGKKMYYAYKVHRMSKKTREAIIARCDCPMPQECKEQVIEDETK